MRPVLGRTRLKPRLRGNFGASRVRGARSCGSTGGETQIVIQPTDGPLIERRTRAPERTRQRNRRWKENLYSCHRCLGFDAHEGNASKTSIRLVRGCSRKGKTRLFYTNGNVTTNCRRETTASPRFLFLFPARGQTSDRLRVGIRVEITDGQQLSSEGNAMMSFSHINQKEM